PTSRCAPRATSRSPPTVPGVASSWTTTFASARGSVLAVGVLDLPDHHGDRGRVDAGLLHQRGGPLDVIGVDGVAEVLDPADLRQLLQDQGSVKVAFIHHGPPRSIF